MFKIYINTEEFFEKMKLLLKEAPKTDKPSSWMRSAEVQKLLKISNSTLQTMRINGSIPAYKIGSTWFYKREEINAALEAGKVKGGKDAK